MIVSTLAIFWATAPLALAQEAGAQPQRVIQDKETGYSLPYPSDWEYRKERLYSLFTIPLSEGRKAEVQMVSTPFRGQKEAWQEAQAQVAKTLNRNVERQWEEVILGVPLLMTRLTFVEGETPTTTLVGLIYSRNPVKLSFRMTSPSEGAAEAEEKWRSALNGIRTLSGSLPTTEDPTQAAAPAPTRPQEQPRITTLRPRSQSKARPDRSDQVVPMDVLGQSLQIRVPRGWALQKDDSGYFLSHPRLKGSVRLDFGAGQALDMARACASASGSFNTKFQTVPHREEKEIGVNRSGARRYQILRRGTSQEGFLMALVTGGHEGLHYWITLYSSASEKEAKADQKLLEALHESLLLGPRP